jgi:hypothetical protein
MKERTIASLSQMKGRFLAPGGNPEKISGALAQKRFFDGICI